MADAEFARTKRAVLWPSVEAVTYQSHALIRELNRINNLEYPYEASQLRDVLLCAAKYVSGELVKLCSPELEFDEEENSARVRALGRMVHSLYSFVRYLRGSSPAQTPPSIQIALAQLTRLHFPAESKPLCLIRPQWRYNLTYVSLTAQIEDLLRDAALDPSGDLGVSPHDEVLPALWKKYHVDDGTILPGPIAVLSFAGLDTTDTLLFPLLGHELGHFIDFRHSPPLNLSPDVRATSQIKSDDVLNVVRDYYESRLALRMAEIYRRDLVTRTSACLRELLADLIAARMLGLSFFISLAEFLKTLAPWPQPSVTGSGYPGLRFRLKVTFDHICSPEFPGNPFDFARHHRIGDHSDIAGWLDKYLNEWQDRFSSSAAGVFEPDVRDEVRERLEPLVEKAILSTLPKLIELARQEIPDGRCARLSPLLFERITRIEADLPPYCHDEDRNGFSEVFAAAWVYQLIHGDIRERSSQDPLSEYNKTCRLVLKAIELLGSSVGMTPPGEPTFSPQGNIARRGGALGSVELQRRMKAVPVQDSSHIGMIPYNPSSIQGASLELKLGSWFVATKRARLESVTIGDDDSERLLASVGREEIFIPDHQTFLIHPGDLVLGSSFEFIAIPNDVMAFVEGRSSLGRQGLSVATATHIGPGFHGVVVLELTNLGRVPLKLSPGMAIAQLVFVLLDEPTNQPYRGRSYCQIRP